jgi:hypothetical protein
MPSFLRRRVGEGGVEVVEADDVGERERMSER